MLASIWLVPLAAPCLYAEDSDIEETLKRQEPHLLHRNAMEIIPEAIKNKDMKAFLVAKRLLEIAADMNFSPSIQVLGILYEKGMGVEADASKAEDLYKKAIALGNTDAMVSYSEMLLSKEDPSKLELLISLIERAAKRGHEGAIQLLKNNRDVKELVLKRQHEIRQTAMDNATEMTLPSDNTSLVVVVPSGKSVCYKLSNVPREFIQMALLTNDKLDENKFVVFENQDQEPEEKGLTYKYDENGLGQCIIHNYMPTNPGTLYILANNLESSVTMVVGRYANDNGQDAVAAENKGDSRERKGKDQGSESTPVQVSTDTDSAFSLNPWLIGALLLLVLSGVGYGAHTLLRKKPEATKVVTPVKYDYYYELHITEDGNKHKVPVDLDALERTPMFIGRSSSCHITLSDKKVSSKHCAISARGGKLFLTDLGSTNGTKVNGSPVPANQSIALHGGNTVSIGNSQININKYHSK